MEYFGIAAIIILLIVLYWIVDKSENQMSLVIGPCSERRLYSLNELTYFKTVDSENSATFYRVLCHQNHKYDYTSYYYLYYESIRLSDYDGLHYKYDSKDYKIMKDADKPICSERDQFLNCAIPITEEEYNEVKKKFIETIS